MDHQRSVIGTILNELEDHLGRSHVVVSQDPEPDLRTILGNKNRPVYTLPTMSAGAIDIATREEPQGPVLFEGDQSDPFRQAIEALRSSVEHKDPLFLLPAWERRPQRSRISSMAVTIGQVLGAFREHAVTMMVPGTLLKSSSPNDRYAAFVSQPSLVIGVDHVGHELGIHAQFAVGIVHVQPATRMTKFFGVRGDVAPESVASDLRRLLRQDGGRTTFGFVHRQRIPVEEPLWPDRWSPQLKAKIADLGALGETVPLRDLADVRVLFDQRVSDAG